MSGKTPTLTERRKAATQLDIARAAARLFTEHGAQGTTAEAIAAAAGVAPRTFYRYFRTKEDAVAPLLVVGADSWREHLASTPEGTPLLKAVEDAIHKTISAADATTEFSWTRGLLRAASGDDSALAAVWHRVNGESETRLRPVLARLTPETDEVTVHLVAAAATDAIRISLELWAGTEEKSAPVELAVRCFRGLSAGLVSADHG
ncbi:TetR/AcrR family transcriptional regulator [Amycolatopsis sp. FU40]|uniref:TetR/AcrR family transcriptional regulator n=1 Tax=Amycolatopsis sp. FU40 TaxID=2914159 RepID=UPI001F353771|nr:TetR/AcrR family transcriptional regulator [Amycolatopsis sp. FU40]UKD56740.1 TetR/AcrR family transcriptional regulator [Amycolatopsis sp. FU40]